jgi:hypothetical protein
MSLSRFSHLKIAQQTSALKSAFANNQPRLLQTNASHEDQLALGLEHLADLISKLKSLPNDRQRNRLLEQLPSTLPRLLATGDQLANLSGLLDCLHTPNWEMLFPCLTDIQKSSLSLNPSLPTAMRWHVLTLPGNEHFQAEIAQDDLLTLDDLAQLLTVFTAEKDQQQSLNNLSEKIITLLANGNVLSNILKLLEPINTHSTITVLATIMGDMQHYAISSQEVHGNIFQPSITDALKIKCLYLLKGTALTRENHAAPRHTLNKTRLLPFVANTLQITPAQWAVATGLAPDLLMLETQPAINAFNKIERHTALNHLFSDENFASAFKSKIQNNSSYSQYSSSNSVLQILWHYVLARINNHNDKLRFMSGAHIDIKANDIDPSKEAMIDINSIDWQDTFPRLSKRTQTQLIMMEKIFEWLPKEQHVFLINKTTAPILICAYDYVGDAIQACGDHVTYEKTEQTRRQILEKFCNSLSIKSAVTALTLDHNHIYRGNNYRDSQLRALNTMSKLTKVILSMFLRLNERDLKHSLWANDGIRSYHTYGQTKAPSVQIQISQIEKLLPSMTIKPSFLNRLTEADTVKKQLLQQTLDDLKPHLSSDGKIENPKQRIILIQHQLTAARAYYINRYPKRTKNLLFLDKPLIQLLEATTVSLLNIMTQGQLAEFAIESLDLNFDAPENSCGKQVAQPVMTAGAACVKYIDKQGSVTTPTTAMLNDQTFFATTGPAPTAPPAAACALAVEEQPPLATVTRLPATKEKPSTPEIAQKASATSAPHQQTPATVFAQAWPVVPHARVVANQETQQDQENRAASYHSPTAL